MVLYNVDCLWCDKEFYNSDRLRSGKVLYNLDRLWSDKVLYNLNRLWSGKVLYKLINWTGYEVARCCITWTGYVLQMNFSSSEGNAMCLPCTKNKTTDVLSILYHLIDLELWSSYYYEFRIIFRYSTPSGLKVWFRWSGQTNFHCCTLCSILKWTYL